MMRYFFLALAISLLPLLTVSYEKISNTNELISAMQKKYGKSWYKTATFVQETTNVQPDGTSKTETWYEAMSVPVVCASTSHQRLKVTTSCLPTAKFTFLKTARLIICGRSSIRC